MGTPQTQTHRRFAFPRSVVLLGLASFFTDVSTEMIYPLLPTFIAALGGGPLFLGLVDGVADAVSSALKLYSGRLADSGTRKKPLIIFGYGLSTVARPLIALATAPWHILAVRVTDRIGKGIRQSPRDAVIAAAAPDGGAARAFGFHRAMDHLGAVVGPLVAAWLLWIGLAQRSVFFAAAIPGIASLLSLAALRDPTSARPSAPSASEPSNAASPRPLPRRFWSYVGILGLFCLANSSDAFLLLRATEVGVQPHHIPLLWVLLHVVKFSSSYAGGWLGDRHPRVALILMGWAVYVATYTGLALVRSPLWLWFILPAYGLYFGLAEPAEKALVKDLVRAESWGTAFGVYNFVVGAAAIPAGLLTGYLWQRFGPPLALGVGAGVAAIACVLLLVWRGSARARPAAASANASN